MTTDDFFKKANGTNSSEELLSKLSEGDRKKIESVLNDKDKLNQLLNSQMAKMLMKKYGSK